MASQPVAALMSIRRQYSDLIFEGQKKVELRRVAMKKNVSHVVVYESGGSCKVVGFFEVSHVYEGRPSTIWKKFRAVTGLTKAEFDAYYAGSDVAVAMGVGKPVRLKEPRVLADFEVVRPPQSFMYLSINHLEQLK